MPVLSSVFVIYVRSTVQYLPLTWREGAREPLMPLGNKGLSFSLSLSLPLSLFLHPQPHGPIYTIYPTSYIINNNVVIRNPFIIPIIIPRSQGASDNE